ncbi:caskin-1-like [Ostrinia nubilalis]|uniref:caskin-1-like n=1 Tax=Ostrinia nubilalis TaxID=29057 RepID=UPI00308269F3
MAPPPEYDKEPKAPDKSAVTIANDDSKLLHNIVNDQQTNSDHKPSNTAANTEVENNKQVVNLDDGQLRALLDEAMNYKCPKDLEGKSNLFKELLEEVEQQDDQASEAAARGVGAARAPRRSAGGGARSRHALHSNSLQDLVAALAAESAPRRPRHHAPAPAPVSTRAIQGGSLPSGVDTYLVAALAAESAPRRPRHHAPAPAPVSTRAIQGGSLPSGVDTYLVAALAAESAPRRPRHHAPAPAPVSTRAIQGGSLPSGVDTYLVAALAAESAPRRPRHHAPAPAPVSTRAIQGGSLPSGVDTYLVAALAAESAPRRPRHHAPAPAPIPVRLGHALHSNSLQDLVAALAAESAPRRPRHHAPAPAPVSTRAIQGGSLPSGVDTSFLLGEEGGGARYLATVRCVNPPPLGERRVSASDANGPDLDPPAARRSKPVFPMTYTARATLEIGSGSVCSGRAVTTTTASNQGDSAIPFSCITTPEVVASCNTTSSTPQSAVAVDPKPLQLGSGYRAVASLTGAAPPPAAQQLQVFVPRLALQPRSVISSSFNGLPLSRPCGAAPSDQQVPIFTVHYRLQKSLDENGNAVQGFSSPVSGSGQHKKPRRKKSSKNETVIKSHQIDGYQGNKDLNEVLRFIESHAERPKHDKHKKRSAERRKDKDKPPRASSLEELSRTTLEELTAPAPAPPPEPEPAPPEPEPADFQTVTKRRAKRRPRPPAPGSNDSNDDLDPAGSPPAAPPPPPPAASYADIARTRHNIPDLIESCNFYAEGEAPPPEPPRADDYPALGPRARHKPPPRAPRTDRAPPPAPQPAPAPDVVCLHAEFPFGNKTKDMSGTSSK